MPCSCALTISLISIASCASGETGRLMKGRMAGADDIVWRCRAGAIVGGSLWRARRMRCAAHSGNRRTARLGRGTAGCDATSLRTSTEAHGNRLGHWSAHCVHRGPRYEHLIFGIVSINLFFLAGFTLLLL